MPVTIPALGTARSSPASAYIPYAASGLSSRKGLPGSRSRSTRSRTSSLPRPVWCSRAAAGPPRRTRPRGGAPGGAGRAGRRRARASPPAGSPPGSSPEQAARARPREPVGVLGHEPREQRVVADRGRAEQLVVGHGEEVGVVGVAAVEVVEPLEEAEPALADAH